MKKFVAMAILGLAACAVSATDVQAGCYYYPQHQYPCYPQYQHSCSNCCQPHLRYVQPSGSFVHRSGGAVVRGTREVLGDVAAVVTTVHPVIRIADCMGIIDRRQIVRNIRGY